MALDDSAVVSVDLQLQHTESAFTVSELTWGGRVATHVTVNIYNKPAYRDTKGDILDKTAGATPITSFLTFYCTLVEG